VQTDTLMNDDELDAARGSFQQTMRTTSVLLLLSVVVSAFFASWAAAQLTTSDLGRAAIGAALLALPSIPAVILAVRVVNSRLSRTDALADVRRERLRDERAHRDLEQQVADALELAENEPEALRMIERSFKAVVPDALTELLLADNSQAHLTRRAASVPPGSLTGCDVSTPQQCPAARRSRTHAFPDSRAVNACPKLVDRDGSACGAVCIPVSVMGRTVGVIHTVHEVGAPPTASTVQDLQAVAAQAGTRLGMLRIMAETQLQAATDVLTGLLNRRSFENRFLQLREGAPGSTGVLVMADLDHFKAVNDTYGHETGDRALRLFADTLRRTVRAQDLVCRRGGEEFALALPACDLDKATEVLERVRLQLALGVRDAGLPAFTASFGITSAHLSEDLDVVLARADHALFEAKRNGRDRIVAFRAPDAEAVVTDLRPREPSDVGS
jgi:diguanylate cyclase (GGDEF)-like protein